MKYAPIDKKGAALMILCQLFIYGWLAYIWVDNFLLYIERPQFSRDCASSSPRVLSASNIGPCGYVLAEVHSSLVRSRRGNSVGTVIHVTFPGGSKRYREWIQGYPNPPVIAGFYPVQVWRGHVTAVSADGRTFKTWDNPYYINRESWFYTAVLLPLAMFFTWGSAKVLKPNGGRPSVIQPQDYHH